MSETQSVYSTEDVSTTNHKAIYATIASELSDLSRRIGPARDPAEIRERIDSLVNKYLHWSRS